MKKTALFLAAALFLIPAATRGVISAQAADTVQSVVDKHIAAMGGREALSKITSRKSTGTIVVAIAGGPELTGPVELYSKAPTKSRAAISLDLAAVGGPGMLNIEQIFDGTDGWSIDPMQGDKPITGEQLDSMKHNYFPSFFLAKDNADNKLELLPRETVGGKSWIVMKATRPTGSFVTMYFDPATYLIARVVSTGENPQTGGKMQLSGESQDYRTVDGVKVPFLIINSNELQTITMKLTTVQHNVAIDDAMFKKK